MLVAMPQYIHLSIRVARGLLLASLVLIRKVIGLELYYADR